MGVGSAIVDHGLVGVCHGDILVCEGPAVGLDHGLGGGGGGVGVEVLRVGEVGGGDGAACDGVGGDDDVVDGGGGLGAGRAVIAPDKHHVVRACGVKDNGVDNCTPSGILAQLRATVESYPSFGNSSSKVTRRLPISGYVGKELFAGRNEEHAEVVIV